MKPPEDHAGVLGAIHEAGEQQLPDPEPAGEVLDPGTDAAVESPVAESRPPKPAEPVPAAVAEQTAGGAGGDRDRKRKDPQVGDDAREIRVKSPSKIAPRTTAAAPCSMRICSRVMSAPRCRRPDRASVPTQRSPRRELMEEWCGVHNGTRNLVRPARDER